jgi:hypothetical protein
MNGLVGKLQIMIYNFGSRALENTGFGEIL